jgi:transcriptional regulator NrdR family protein
MNCPKCGFGHSIVIDARRSGFAKRRRRVCSGCGLRYTSYEMLDFDYEKLMNEREEVKKAIKILEGLNLGGN